jgi:hypothetical protein
VATPEGVDAVEAVAIPAEEAAEEASEDAEEGTEEETAADAEKGAGS